MEKGVLTKLCTLMRPYLAMVDDVVCDEGDVGEGPQSRRDCPLKGGFGRDCHRQRRPFSVHGRATENGRAPVRYLVHDWAIEVGRAATQGGNPVRPKVRPQCSWTDVHWGRLGGRAEQGGGGSP